MRKGKDEFLNMKVKLKDYLKTQEYEKPLVEVIEHIKKNLLKS